MENAPPPLTVEEVQRPASSLASRLLNVFAAPGDVFEEIRTSTPSTANWLVPLLLTCLVGVGYVFAVFSQESILQSMREAQEKAMQKQVEAGKLTQQQAEQRLEIAQQFAGPTLIKVFGSVGVVVVNLVMLFFVALVVWLVGKLVFKGGFSYLKAMEVAGLAGTVNILGGIVAMLLAVVMGNMAMTPGPVLLVHEFDPANKLHVFLSQLNVFMVWYIALLSLGLAKLCRVAFGKAAIWLYCVWAALVSAIVLPGWGR
jgi:Yip1-like protein